MSRTFRITTGDLEYDVRGQPAFVTGKPKTSQDLNECTVVPVNDIGFGMGLVELIGTVQDPNDVPSLLQSRITDGITRLQRIMNLNQRLVRGNDEIIASIVAVSASPQTANNHTDFKFSYAVNTVSGGEALRTRGSL